MKIIKRRWLLIVLVPGILFCVLLIIQRLQTLPPQKTDIRQPGGQQEFNKEMHSISKTDSLWAVVNKGRKLPADYIPTDLVSVDVPVRFNADAKMRQQAAKSLKELFNAAEADNVSLLVVSAYRSYEYQSTVYNRSVNVHGQTVTDATSAKPGHSEHQTGWAVDIGTIDRRCELEECFADTIEGRWLENNAHRYGFIIRYPRDTQNITGYSYEPWHIRFVGQELASEMKKNNNRTLEQFFGLNFYATYPSEIVLLSSR